MNQTDFRRLFRYSDTCWALLGETLTGVPAARETWDMRFDTTSPWKTVRLLLAHSLGAEERLVTVRLQNRPLPVVYEERAAADWAGLFRDQQTIRAATDAYLDSLTEAELASETEVWRIADRALTRADLLFQILNHENYHRGQVIMALQQRGIDPPGFDYVLLKAP